MGKQFPLRKPPHGFIETVFTELAMDSKKPLLQEKKGVYKYFLGSMLRFTFANASREWFVH
jgi:hypothetical protein